MESKRKAHEAQMQKERMMREMKIQHEKEAILEKIRMDKIKQDARIEAQRELDEENFRIHDHGSSNFMAAGGAVGGAMQPTAFTAATA